MIKKPKTRFNPSSDKTPRVAEDPELKYASSPIVWQFHLLDTEGPFSAHEWKNICPNYFWETFIVRIKNYESMTWAEIRKPKKKNHSVRVADLCSDAQKRLDQLNQEVEEVFSIAFSNKERLFGIIDRQVFKVLWWDPEHKIYPSNLKHT